MIKNISFIVPAKYEYENLKKLIPYLIKFSENKNYLYQIIVVQGVDTDIDTNLLCKKYNLEIINRKHETFKDALILGIEKSEYETLVTLDADLSHNIGDLQNGLEIFSKEDCDLILFSRHMHDSSFKERYLNFIVSKITNFFLRIISKIKINDYTNNFRIYKKSLFEHVEFNSTHFEILFEIIYRFNRLNDNLKIVEIPTIHQKREFGKSKKRHFYYLFKMMNLLIKLNRE